MNVFETLAASETLSDLARHTLPEGMNADEVLLKMQSRNRTYIVRFKNPALSTQPVVASRAEIQGDHVVMHDSEGRLVALFWMSIVESWSEIDHPGAAC